MTNRFDTRDRLTAVEQELGRVRDQVDGSLGREPTIDSPTTVILGQCTATVGSGASTFQVDNIIVGQGGIDPREDPTDSEEAVTIQKRGSGSRVDNDWVMAFQGADGKFYADILNASGGGGGEGAAASAEATATFKLTEELTHGMTAVQGQLLDINGNVITPPTTKFNVADEDAMLALSEGAGPTQIDTNEYVRRLDINAAFQYNGGGTGDLDNWTNAGPAKAAIFLVDKTRQYASPDPHSQPSGFVGLPDYTGADGTSQRAYRGEAKWIKAIDVDTGTPSEPAVDRWSFYEIVWMEGEADELEVQFIAEPPIVPDYSGEPNNESEIPVNIIRVWGANGQNRVPKEFELRDESDGFAIYDNAWYTSGEIADNIITVKRHHATGRYYPTQPSTFHGIGEITSAVGPATKDGNVITLGTGQMKIYGERTPPEEDEIELITAAGPFKVWSQAPESTPLGKDISFEVKRGRRVIHVEPCNEL